MFYSRKEATIEHLHALNLHGLPFFDVYYKYTDELDPKTQLARRGRWFRPASTWATGCW